MALAKTYEVDDTVFVAYPFPASNYFAPVSRTVKKIDVSDTGNDALVSFDEGAPVQDSDTAQTIFSTSALAATAIVDDVITRSAAAVALDADLSVASTVAQPSATLGRVS